jgi:hypothetical protein
MCVQKIPKPHEGASLTERGVREGVSEEVDFAR